MKRLLPVVFIAVACSHARGPGATTVAPVSGPVTTDIAANASLVSRMSVMRVVCKTTMMGGTGFLHHSGNVITAAHVVAGCAPAEVVLLSPAGVGVLAKAVTSDPFRDLALVQPGETIHGPAFVIGKKDADLKIGTQVVTWGFPGGYGGASPILSVGYLSGTESVSLSPLASPKQWVVNAAFNHGNSGGPLLSLEDNTVIGVVSGKMDPIPKDIQQALTALKAQSSGFVYTKTFADGRMVNVSEGQVIAEVLEYLRSVTQLVVGHAVTLTDLRAFLTEQKIEP